MGTTMSVSFVASSETYALPIAKEAFATIHAYEKRFSRFLPDSELSQLNTKKDMVVSEEFFTIFIQSHELYRETKGAFNPLLQIARLGYTADFKTLAGTTQHIKQENYNLDFEAIHFDLRTRRIVLHHDHMLDFGGILKGYLAEKISRHVQDAYPECAGNIINLGGDIHTRGTDESGTPFTFTIYNPITHEETPITLHNTSLATSGTYARTWETTAGTRNHILTSDGLTNPQTHIVSASVTHPDGAVAEAYAKVLLIGGADALHNLPAQSPFSYLLITTNGTLITHTS